ncbi:MAG: site-specific integrase [Bacteroidetes bacterium]|nr:site-specific integrase [Bacteroidota bacterium]
MNTKIAILFHLKRSKTTTDGLVPVYMRVTINGERLEISTKRYVEESKWIVSAGKLKGNSEEARITNEYLDTLKAQVYQHQTNLIKLGSPVDIDTMRNKLLGIEEKRRSLVQIFEDHNKQMEMLSGKEFAPGTVERYKTSLKHTTDFLKWKYNVSDVDIRSINHTFVADYEFYLRSVRNCANNTAIKYVRNFGKIINICLANGWIDKNPFANWKAKVKQVERIFLSEEELQTLCNKNFQNQRLQLVKDVFVFSCYTGLAYADVHNLNHSHISIGIDGGKWIFSHRQKTDTKFNIPLLPQAENILNKYADNPQCLNKGKLLPVLSNQKMNAYLKEIADICGINKELTYHTARHTFATTVTLSNGVPIESVSKMLGHKDIKITQHYAKILDKKVSADMNLLKEKMMKKEEAKYSLVKES